MSEVAKNGSTVADITRTYVPSVKMAGLIVATLLLGMWIQRQVLSPIADSQAEKAQTIQDRQALGAQLQRIENDLQQVKQSLGAIPSLEARVIAIERERQESKIEDRLWRDAVWGRVQDLPYKVPSERQSAQRP